MVTPATDGQRWRPPIEDVLEPVFGRMGTSPMIVVIPDGVCRWGCGQWVDSPVTGNFEQYVLHDVIPYVDGPIGQSRAPRVAASSASRLAGSARGTSASRHPDVFGAMAVLSADSWLD
jgi:enterochelin esterase-like enzyme